jgi:hypothetical protein
MATNSPALLAVAAIVSGPQGGNSAPKPPPPCTSSAGWATIWTAVPAPPPAHCLSTDDHESLPGAVPRGESSAEGELVRTDAATS